MKILIKIFFFTGVVLSGFSQISFNACHPLFEDQEYVFNFVETDVTGRNVYTTTPVDGAQTCGGIGTCEFKIAWNDTNSVWEFIADDGNGDFSSPYLIYSNTSPSTPNPPSLILGTWVENNTVTSGDCGGDLSTSNAILTGDVQDTALAIEDNQLESRISIHPNPANQQINIKTNEKIDSISVYDISGKVVIDGFDNLKQIDISNLRSGIYFLKMSLNDNLITKKIIVE